jgi:microcystin-dependent protein
LRNYRKLIIFIVLPLFLYIGNSFSAEQIVGFEKKDLPVLNEELKRIGHEINTVVPIGAIMIWTTDTAPDGWLLCYGQAISRNVYAGLYNIIGETFGAGDSSTTFNVPDLRGRFPLGRDNMGGTSANRVTDTDADTLGNGDGDELKTISHTHDLAHTHDTDIASFNSGLSLTDATASNRRFNLDVNQHIHAIDPPNTTSSAASVETSDSGGSATQDFMNPFQTFSYIIKI